MEVRRLVAALESVFWPCNGSSLPFSGETNAWFQASRGNSGSKLPVWGSIRLLKAGTSRRTPNAPSMPCVQTHAMRHYAGRPRSIATRCQFSDTLDLSNPCRMDENSSIILLPDLKVRIWG
jgi:hypothetical protein